MRNHIVTASALGNGASNVGQDIKVFIILVFTPFSLAKSLFRLDEFNVLGPLYHSIAELVFNTQSQGSAIPFRQRSLVHLMMTRALSGWSSV